MNELVLIDTSGWICFYAREGFEEIKNTVALILDENRAAIAGPVLIELIQGARAEKEKEEIQDCAKGLHWLEVTDDHWYKSAELAFRLRRKGITTSAMDTIIATLAIEYNCLLLNRDAHFDMIAKHTCLKCYNFPTPK